MKTFALTLILLFGLALSAGAQKAPAPASGSRSRTITGKIGPAPRLPDVAPSPRPAPRDAAQGEVPIQMESFESGSLGQGWMVSWPTMGPYAYWGFSNAAASDGFYSAHCAAGGAQGTYNAYLSNMDTWLTFGPFDLSDAATATLLFQAWYETEPGYDLFYWGASIDGSTFYGPEVSGSSNSWTELGIDFSAVPNYGNMLGQSQVWIGFNFSSDAATEYRGVYLDNIRLWKTVHGQLPGIVYLTTPSDGATGVGTTPVLDWSDAAGADYGYHLQVSRSSDFSTTVIDDRAVSSSGYAVPSGLLVDGAAYYWRVRGIGGGGDGPWSTAYMFSTGSSGLVAPSLLSPADGAGGVAVTPALDWSDASGATSYHVQVGTSLGFEGGTVVVDEDFVSNSALTVASGRLVADGQYYWRVLAHTGGGDTPWSVAYSFHTSQAAPAAAALVWPPADAVGISQQPTLRWEAAAGAASYRLQVAPDAGFSTMTVEAGDLTGTSYTVGQGVLAANQPYYWRVVSVGPGGQTPSPARRFTTYLDAFERRQTLSFGDAKLPGSYQLVSVPGNADMSVQSAFSGSAGKDWIAYDDNGQAENYLVAFDGSGRFTLRPGRGLWVLGRSRYEVAPRQVPTVALDTDGTYAIALHDGWNIIGTPFERQVSWAAVQAANGITEKLWGFSGSFRESANMVPYYGYYFFNRDNRSSLRIPYDGRTGAGKSGIPAWTPLTLQARTDAGLLSSVRMGVAADAAEGLDALDQFAPPADFAPVSLVLVNRDLGRAHYRLSEEARPQGEGQVFDLELTVRPGEEADLEVTMPEGLQGQTLRLVDRETGRPYEAPVRFRGQAEPRRLALMLGDAAFVAAKSAELLPEGFTLLPNYPNPFNGSTVLAYTIPRGAGNVAVRLEIFNLLGQRVAVLVDRREEPGYHEARWDGRTATGLEAATGVYLYRLSTPGTTLTGRMVLLR